MDIQLHDIVILGLVAFFFFMYGCITNYYKSENYLKKMRGRKQGNSSVTYTPKNRSKDLNEMMENVKEQLG